MRFGKKALGLGTVVAIMVGCGGAVTETDESPTRTESFALLAKAMVRNGNTVEFYETDPGDVIVSETGPIDNTWTFTAADLSGRSPVELFESIPDHPATPPALIEANARREARLATQEVGAKESIAKTAQALSTGVRSGSCADAGLFASGGPNGGGMIGTRATSGKDLVYDKHFYQFTLCVYAGQTGTVSMDAYTRPWWDWNYRGYWVTQPGTFRWWSNLNQDRDFDARTRWWNGNALKIDTYTNCYPADYNCWH
jgi:hypothetical protein